MSLPQRFTVPFGGATVDFDLPRGLNGTVAEPPRATPLDDPTRSAMEAMNAPISGPSLTELARGKRRVCIAVTDATRACPDHLLVPPMLDALATAGVADEAITILVAVGVHRASTHDEKVAKLGRAIVDRYHVIDHDATDTDLLVPIDGGPRGLPFRINRHAVEADLLMATGVVEPHQYAGFSGGGKTVAIGCANDAVIAATHGPAMLDQPGTRLARLDGNPFQAAVRLVADAAGLAFVGNAVLDAEGRIVALAYGPAEPVHDHLSSVASHLYTVPIPRAVDIAITGVGAPKDVNLYQASRAASYLQFAPTPVARDGGVIIIPATCPEGAGEGAGERRFLEVMGTAGGPAAIIEQARRDGIRPGEQRAYIMARVLERATVIVAGAVCPDEVQALGFGSTSTIEDALAEAITRVGTPADVLVVPHALQTLPVIVGPAVQPTATGRVNA